MCFSLAEGREAEGANRGTDTSHLAYESNSHGRPPPHPFALHSTGSARYRSEHRADPGAQRRPLEVALLTRTRESCAAPSLGYPRNRQRNPPRGIPASAGAQGCGRRSFMSHSPARSRSPPRFLTLHASPRTPQRPQTRDRGELRSFQVSRYRPAPQPHPGTPQQSLAVRLLPAGSARLRSCPGFPPRCRFLIPQPCSDLLGNANPRGSACPEALGLHLSVCPGGETDSAHGGCQESSFGCV